MPRPRYRIRYRKLDDLRLVGHHDLVRLWERLLRRADVKPAMSEGFHPRVRMNFPSALAVGIGGLDEVMELELSEERDPTDLAAAIERQAPEGLSVAAVEPMGDGTRFSQPAAAAYEVPLPADEVARVKARIEARRAAVAVNAVGNAVPGGQGAEGQGDRGAEGATASPDLATADAGGPSESDAVGIAVALPEHAGAASASPAPQNEPWPDSIRELDVVDGVLRMNLRLGEAGAVRPRDLLAQLELAELENQGFQITRTRVELSP